MVGGTAPPGRHPSFTRCALNPNCLRFFKKIGFLENLWKVSRVNSENRSFSVFFGQLFLALRKNFENRSFFGTWDKRSKLRRKPPPKTGYFLWKSAFLAKIGYYLKIPRIFLFNLFRFVLASFWTNNMANKLFKLEALIPEVSSSEGTRRPLNFSKNFYHIEKMTLYM